MQVARRLRPLGEAMSGWTEPSDTRPDAGTIGGCCALALSLDLVGFACLVVAVCWLLGWRW